MNIHDAAWVKTDECPASDSTSHEKHAPGDTYMMLGPEPRWRGWVRMFYPNLRYGGKMERWVCIRTASSDAFHGKQA